MRYLEERKIGFPTAYGAVPIVPAAILFDLGVGDPKVRPAAGVWLRGPPRLRRPAGRGRQCRRRRRRHDRQDDGAWSAR